MAAPSAATPQKHTPAPKLDVEKSLPGYQAKVGRFDQLTLEAQDDPASTGTPNGCRQ